MPETKRVALITGANKGIGLEIARQLGRAGLTVLLGARNAVLGQEAAANLRAQGVDAQFIELDLGREETIHTAAKTIENQFKRLDVLVNNAGITDAGDGPPSSAAMSAVRRIMETNFFGALSVTQAMLPLLRKAPAGRIVNLSSGLASLAYNADPDWSFAGVKLIGYNTSKTALNMLTVQLAHELRGTAIKVNSANPGYTATDMTGGQGTQSVVEGAAEPVRLALLPDDGPTGGFFEAGGSNPW